MQCVFVSINLYAASDLDQGYTALANKELIKATQFFQMALKTNPNLISAKIGLAKTYKRRGYKKLLQELINDILKQQTNHIEALLLQGQLYMWENDWLSAKSVFNRILNLDANNIQALSYLSNTLNSMGDVQAADVVNEKIKQLQENP